MRDGSQMNDRVRVNLSQVPAEQVVVASISFNQRNAEFSQQLQPLGDDLQIQDGVRI